VNGKGSRQVIVIDRVVHDTLRPHQISKRSLAQAVWALTNR
jgi:hypothetical protein